MSTMLTALSKYLHEWTPLSVVIILLVLAAIFIVIWDSLHGIPIPSFIGYILSFIGGGAGGAAASVSTAKEMAKTTATAVAESSNGNGDHKS